MTTTTTTTSDRQSHRWTTEELDFLLSMPTAKRGDLVAAFRAAFPDFDASDTSLVNRRYTLLHKSSGPRAIEALTAKVAALESSLESARQALDAAKSSEIVAASEKAEKVAAKAKAKPKASKVADEPVFTELTINELRKLAKERGVSGAGTKADIAARL